MSSLGLSFGHNTLLSGFAGLKAGVSLDLESGLLGICFSNLLFLIGFCLSQNSLSLLLGTLLSLRLDSLSLNNLNTLPLLSFDDIDSLVCLG